MIMTGNTIEAAGLTDFFKNLVKSSVKIEKKLAKNVIKTLLEFLILQQTLLLQLQVDLLETYHQH